MLCFWLFMINVKNSLNKNPLCFIFLLNTGQKKIRKIYQICLYIELCISIRVLLTGQKCFIFNAHKINESQTSRKMWIGRSVLPLSGSLSPQSKWPRFELWTVNLTWKMTETLPPHQECFHKNTVLSEREATLYLCYLQTWLQWLSHSQS